MESLQRKSWFWSLATAGFIIAAFLVWIPRSWETYARDPEGKVTMIEVGVIHPLTFAWESWAEGVQFRVAQVRPGPLVVSAILTSAAGMVGAPWCYRRGKRAAEQSAAEAG